MEANLEIWNKEKVVLNQIEYAISLFAANAPQTVICTLVFSALKILRDIAEENSWLHIAVEEDNAGEWPDIWRIFNFLKHAKRDQSESITVGPNTSENAIQVAIFDFRTCFDKSTEAMDCFELWYVAYTNNQSVLKRMNDYQQAIINQFSLLFRADRKA